MAGVEQGPEHPPVIKTEALNGDEYQATLRGEGYISSDHDDGTFIASISASEKDRLWEEYKAGNYTGDPSFLNRTLLDMAGLFPKSWRESQVEFEITVKAKRVSPYIDPAAGD